MTFALSARERLDRLRLARTDHVGPVTFQQLLTRFGSAGRAIEALPEMARRGGARTIRIASKGEAERELGDLERLGAALVCLGEPDYPALLAALSDAPPVLALRGHATLARRPTVALVGARNASVNGRAFARAIAHELATNGWVVVSGLARGIDRAAHDGALAHPEGGTVAALAGGIDVVYPPEHDVLQHVIGDRGLLVAEQPPGTRPLARHFPRRNRIISGLSLGVVVIEAALKSGSLITAEFAAEQGREVCAVPGSPLDPRCRGANRLLREGATLIESAEDVMTALAPRLRLEAPRQASGGFGGGETIAEEAIARAHPVVLEMLGPHPVAVDELMRECQVSPAVLLAVLLDLELAGRLERHPGNQVSLVMGAPANSR